MTRFLLRRLALTIPILIGVSIVMFITIKITPGDPVASLLGPTGSPEARVALTEKLGLDRPLIVQYAKWFGNILQGDAGISIARQTGALGLVWDAMQNTLVLAGFAAILAMVVGVTIGLTAAVYPDSVLARVVSGFSLFAISIPQYSLALISIVYLAANLGWFPTGGMNDPSGEGGLGDLLHHLWLPGIASALVPLGIIARMVRSAMIDALNEDYIEALRSRGLPRSTVTRHAFHNAIPGILTIAGLQAGYLLGGVVFVETVFSWPGMGLLIFQSISQRDLPVIQAGVLLSALAFVLINLVVDTIQASIDPRLRR